MARKKDHAVVAVISDLTQAQAAEVTREIVKAKSRYAPSARGTVASCLQERVFKALQGGQRLLGCEGERQQ